MSRLGAVGDLYRHQAWADAAIWRAVAASDAAWNDAVIQDRLGHAHLVEWLFLQGWQGSAIAAHLQTFPDAASRMKWGRAYHDLVPTFLATLDADHLERPFALPWAAMIEQSLGRAPDPVTLGDTLLQVPMHSTYHRGQVAARLREVGGEPPTTDFIVWAFLGKPAPEWLALANR